MTSNAPGESPRAAGPTAAAAPQEDDIDAVPDAVRDAARAAFALRDREAEVLELTYDSVFDRGAVQPRALSFGAEDGAPVVELEVTDRGEQRDLLVRCALPEADLLAVEHMAGRTPFEEAGPGSWSAAGVPPGSCSVVLSAGGRRVRTSWTLV